MVEDIVNFWVSPKQFADLQQLVSELQEENLKLKIHINDLEERLAIKNAQTS